MLANQKYFGSVLSTKFIDLAMCDTQNPVKYLIDMIEFRNVVLQWFIA